MVEPNIINTTEKKSILLIRLILPIRLRQNNQYSCYFRFLIPNTHSH